MERETEVVKPERADVAPAASATTEYDQERPLVESPPRPRVQSRRPRRRVHSNPLLDTISAIGDDEDDECLGLGERKCAHSDGDTYTGYMGGSSIDSGYKSCCPTPEMVDIAYYSTTLSPAEQRKRLSVASQTSQTSQTSQASSSSLSGALGVAQKPRIAMGTKVMSRQLVGTCAVEPRRRHDSGFSDAAHGHLTGASQSLAPVEPASRLPTADAAAAPPPRLETAPTRPRSASMGSAAAVSPRPARRAGSPGPPPHSRPPPPPGYPRRRSSSPLPPRQGPAAGQRPQLPPARPDRQQPARAAARRDAPGRPSRRTREEDIDTLMYGRPPPAVVPSADLLAPSRRADISMVQTGPTPRPGPGPDPASGHGRDRTSAHSLPTGLQCPAGRVAGGARPTNALRSRFSHMAQCMLDIIEELQSKGRMPRPAECTSAAADYHTYEEVLYGALAARERVREATPSPEPPPLPLRPAQLFVSAADAGRAAGAARAARRTNAPKQRNNLYSLFSSVRDRRSLSQSLEQEFSSGADADEYGFAVRK